MVNKEFLKMQKLAGLITESQMKDKLKENSGIDWNDYEGYETLLDELFEEYNLEDPQEFKDQIFDGASDVANQLAIDIAQRAGFTGDVDDLVDTELDSYTNALADKFLLKFGADMGVIDENDPEYVKEMQRVNQIEQALESKIIQQYPL
jgi:hypothetical protein